MDDGLGMHGYIDKRSLNIEKQGSLDELKPLVNQGCRVQRIHLPHRPGWVRRSLFRGDLPHLFPSPASKWPSRRGQQDRKSVVRERGQSAVGAAALERQRTSAPT